MGDAGRDSAGLAQQMLGWVTVPGSWHVAGQSPSVTEPEMVADEHRLLSLPPDCSQAAFSLGNVQGRGQICAGASCAVPQRHQEPEQKPRLRECTVG